MFYEFQKKNKFEESEKIFTKFILPVHQKFSNHITFFKQFPCLTLEAKIKIYTLKVMKNLENAKCLCKNEYTNERDGEKFFDELMLQKFDLDYDTIHSEILDNIIFDENDSGLSDFDSGDDENEKQEHKIFEINKIKTIIHKSVKTLFTESQENTIFMPLIQQEKELLKKEENNSNNEINMDNKLYGLNNNNEIKTQENTEDNTEDIKDSEIKPIINENKSSDIIYEKKKKEIKNYKKYNFYTDPYSNYNNFTKKYKVKNNAKKRFRDIHPFLKTFNPKFLKKENIDKKIFRRFRKFVKILYKENKNSPIFSKNAFFWKKFYVKNLLPPVKIVLNNGEIIQHKSFNTQYLLWLFNQEGTTELFKLFLKTEEEKVINNFVTEYNLNQSKEPDIIEKLKEYINYIPEIYDISHKKEIFDGNNELLDTNGIIGKKDDNNTNLESFDSEVSFSNNPFNLKFEFIDKKQFKEFPYDNDNYYYLGDNISNVFFKKSEENEIKNEKIEFDDVCIRQLTTSYYK